MEDASLGHDALIAGTDLLAQGCDDSLVTRSDLVAHSRKLSMHFVSKLRNLHRESLNASGQLLENRHALFQSFYSSLKGLRRHDVSIQVSRTDTQSFGA